MAHPTPIIQTALNTERKAEIWEMKVRQGVSVKGIADSLGLSTSTVYKYLNAVIREAEETLDADVFRWKLEQHYKYDHIYAESIAAWERSKRDLRRDKIKREPGKAKDVKPGDVIPSEIVTTTEGQVGDSRYLNAAVAALQAQAKLWGFNAPDMLETTNRNLNITATVEPTQVVSAVQAAEAAFRERKYGPRTVPALQAQSGPVVPIIREDQPPDEG